MGILFFYNLAVSTENSRKWERVNIPVMNYEYFSIPVVFLLIHSLWVERQLERYPVVQVICRDTE